MIEVFTPKNPKFNYSECKKMYEDNQHLLEDDSPFFDVIKNTFFYSFKQDKKHIGCIYYYEKDDKLFVNVVAGRKTPLINLKCFKESLTWWNCDIYAKAHHKTSIYGMLKCGFKKIGNNLYKYER